MRTEGALEYRHCIAILIWSLYMPKRSGLVSKLINLLLNLHILLLVLLCDMTFIHVCYRHIVPSLKKLALRIYS